jgi:uncharacterized protein YbjT (DUF2867 family)
VSYFLMKSYIAIPNEGQRPACVRHTIGEEISMILLTGGTGTAGSAISKALVGMGVRHRSLVRNLAKAAESAGPNVDLVEGDLSRPETLDAVLEGVEKALLLTAPSPDAPQQERNFIQAAKRAGVGHVVKFSAYGAGLHAPHYFGRQHGEGERELEESGLTFTMLRPNGFFQNFLGNAGSIQARSAFHAPAGEMKLSAVDVRDIAAVAAHVLTEAGHEWQRYTITGPAAISHTEIAERLSDVLGRTIRYIDVPEEAAGQVLLAAGLPAWQVDKILDLYRYYKSGAAAEVTYTVERVGRKTPIAFEQFVRDYAAVFGRGS